MSALLMPDSASASAAGSNRTTLGEHVLGQLLRLAPIAGLTDADTRTYGQVLMDSLADTAHRPLTLPPASLSFISDDHTPVEFSLAFTPDAAPTLRMLVEPGCASGDMAESGRVGLKVIREMADRWNFSTAQLDVLEDLLFPDAAEGPMALWYALDLRPGGIPGVKVYLNPSVDGPENAARTVREALYRLGHADAFAALPDGAGYPFIALDLGSWATPRARVYVKHPRMSADDAVTVSRTAPDLAEDQVRSFFRLAAESVPLPGRKAGESPRLLRRPALTCHAFTDRETASPSGFTLHIPVRDYVRDDEEALARATALLTHFGMDASALRRALAALTSRELTDGVGLIAYLALAHQQHRQPRVTVYLSSEAYAVRPPPSLPPRESSAP
ncbi:prenyltransferase [Streptomyces sp. NBC_01381]|uniref:tryptophan dimethylallyltransferase family protein n=1 Tax=Streptomyces sp. NBC_01381 TaxID=2903845 RepID=UPI0022518647|nr:tryptophan dimethylallyltransferase family protein [Streptomyces sp. NBC_01381]MCX4671900.1 prenyltransferase [Streptomyces sp. NBC_01381]